MISIRKGYAEGPPAVRERGYAGRFREKEGKRSKEASKHLQEMVLEGGREEQRKGEVLQRSEEKDVQDQKE